MLRLFPVFRRFPGDYPPSWHTSVPTDSFWESLSTENSCWSCIIIYRHWSACFLTGWLHRLHGVRGRSQSGDARKDGAQAALVLQTLWCGRQRLHRPTRAPQHHKGAVQTLGFITTPCPWRDTDVILFLQAIRAINGNENQDVTAEDFTNRVFDRIDINGDGECVCVFWWFRREIDGGWTVFRHSSAQCCQETQQA